MTGRGAALSPVAATCIALLTLATVVVGARAIALHTGSTGPLVVPRPTTAIVVDGAWHERDWNDTALTGQLVGDDGGPARPFSQARLMVDDSRLLIGLYAADVDVRSTDHFEVTVAGRTLQFDPLGHITPPVEGGVALVDLDGIIDDPKSDDEEWVVEAGIPLASLDLSTGASDVPIAVARCDTPRDGKQRCGAWSATVTLGR